MSRADKPRDATPAPHPNDWGPRTFETTGFSAYRLSVPRAFLTFDLSRLRRERSELIGELVVRLDMAGARTVEGVLSAGDFNLSSVQARTTRAKQLAARALTDDMDWEGWLSELCLRVLAAERLGVEPTLISLIDPPTDAGEFDLAGWTLPRRQPTILFGDGGAGKSLLSLWAAAELARAGEHVMYADWESDGGEHRQRLDKLYPQGLPAVLYARCERSLDQEVDRLRAIVLEHSISYAILDSAGFGCHGAPESAEAAIGYFRAVRSLNIGTLVLAHVTKAEDGDKRPFGSSFWHNSARSTWHVKRSNPDDEGSIVEVLLSQRKCNAGRLRPPMAFSIDFGPSETIVRRSEASDTPEFASSLTTMQRLRGALKGGPKTPDTLTSLFSDQKPDTLARVMRRGVERGILVRFQQPDGVEVVGLKH